MDLVLKPKGLPLRKDLPKSISQIKEYFQYEKITDPDKDFVILDKNLISDENKYSLNYKKYEKRENL